MDTLDPRLLRISIDIGGKLKQYDQNFEIVAAGCKYANANQNECEVKLTNLDQATRDYLLTECSPFNKNRKRKTLIVEAGRVSTGYGLVFVGDMTNAIGSQPPDITVTLKAATSDYSKGKIVATSQPGTAPLFNIASRVASDLGLALNFQASPKMVSNYSYSGSAAKQVDHVGACGRINAYVDDGTLVLKDFNVPLSGRTRVVNIDTGMIGIPEFTEHGVKVRMLFDNRTVIGGGLMLTSKINPAVNGLYVIAKLGFELASRDTPFYYVAEAVRADGAVPVSTKRKSKAKPK